MSKFFRALEQARRDEALKRDVPPRADHSEQPTANESRLAMPPVPSAPSLREEQFDEHLVSLVTPAAFEAEQYRALRHIVEQAHRTTGLKVVAVSSPGTGDGKTTTAINLAGALAQAPEARVLLVDADLRRPAVGRLLDIPDTDGADLVGAFLDPDLSLDRLVQPRPPFNLSVVCAGRAPSSPYEVLKSRRFDELIEEASHRYDYVILDTAPLNSVQDCRVIARCVGGFLVVVAADRTPRRLVEEALATLDRAMILGLVFNVDSRRSSNYSPGYYHPDDPVPAGRPSGALRRVATKVGGSFRRRHDAAGASRSHR